MEHSSVYEEFCAPIQRCIEQFDRLGFAHYVHDHRVKISPPGMLVRKLLREHARRNKRPFIWVYEQIWHPWIRGRGGKYRQDVTRVERNAIIRVPKQKRTAGFASPLLLLADLSHVRFNHGVTFWEFGFNSCRRMALFDGFISHLRNPTSN